MHAIRQLAFVFVTATVLVTIINPAPVAFAQDADAQASAEDFLRSLSVGQFNLVWDQKVSVWLKGRMTRDAFVANMAISRPQLGKLLDIKYVAITHLEQDQATGYRGDIYSIVFRDAYGVGEFYENVWVVKDPDGKYRFSGLYGAAVPKN
jgi:hypothetical protein